MPELPEVELTCRALRDGGLVGNTIVRVTNNDTARIGGAVSDVAGRGIRALWRRGKYIVIACTGDVVMVIHLRMSGRLWVVPAESERSGYERLMCALEDGQELRLHDPRRFATVEIASTAEYLEAKCGVEPLGDDFNVAFCREALHGRRGMLYPLLLNQRIIVGLGNIYCNEALWYACLHPRCRSDALSDEHVALLRKAIRVVLIKGIRYGGTRLGEGAANFLLPGAQGANTERLCVYRREGAPCLRCGTTIERHKIANRSVYLCPRCQVCAPCTP